GRKLCVTLLAEVLDDLSLNRPGQRALHAADVRRRRGRSILTRQHVEKMLQPLRLFFELSQLLLGTVPFVLQRDEHPFLVRSSGSNRSLALLNDAPRAGQLLLAIGKLDRLRPQLFARALEARDSSRVA